MDISSQKKKNGLEICFLVPEVFNKSYSCIFLKHLVDKMIKLDDHIVISNVSQRSGKGGRPALIVNAKNYDVKDLTNTIIQVPRGVVAVWCLLMPKISTNDSVGDIVHIHTTLITQPNVHKDSLCHHYLQFSLISIIFKLFCSFSHSKVSACK